MRNGLKTMQSSAAPPSQNSNLLPARLFLLANAKMWECFSFYGVRSLLLLYRVEALKVYDLRTGSAFFSAIAWAWIANRLPGQRNPVVLSMVLRLRVRTLACSNPPRPPWWENYMKPMMPDAEASIPFSIWESV